MTRPDVAAAAMTALAVALLWLRPRPVSAPARHRPGGRAASGKAGRDDEPPAPAVLAAAGGAVGLVLLGGAGAAGGVAVGLLLPAALARSRAARDRDAVRRALPGVCRVLAAQLRVGVDPVGALAAAADAAPGPLADHLRRAAAGAGLGLDPVSLLAPGPPGAEGLDALATCWRVTAATGAAPAEATDRLAESLAAEERLRAELAAHLAGPRTSAFVLAVLPLAGVALGAGTGADPLGFFRTAPGAGCLALGLALDAAGLAWTLRLGRRALR